MPHHQLNNLGEEELDEALDELQVMHEYLKWAWDICPNDLEFVAKRIDKVMKKIKELIKEVKERISACSTEELVKLD